MPRDTKGTQREGLKRPKLTLNTTEEMAQDQESHPRKTADMNTKIHANKFSQNRIEPRRTQKGQQQSLRGDDMLESHNINDKGLLLPAEGIKISRLKKNLTYHRNRTLDK
jgi:hypothetical protein